VTRIKLIAVPALLVAMLMPTTGTALAQNVPPGVSGANQYTETLPGPGGNNATGGGNSAGGGTDAPKSATQTLGATNARKLEALGPEGKAAAELATETSSVESASSSGSKKAGGKGARQAGRASGGGTGSSTTGESSNAQGSSGVSQVLGQITGTGGSDSGGMDWLLPLLIAASVVLAAVYVFARNRPPRPQD
jgi:hypothetical protein